MSIKSTNPFTEEIIKEFEGLDNSQINEKINLAQEAFLDWRKKTYSERAEYIKKLASILKTKNREIGMLATLEMGKPIKQAIAEVEKCAWAMEYYAENAENILAKEKIDVEKCESYVQFDPMGVILAVMPWNFPFWQVLRFAAPAIMAGNVAILKHASNVPQCSLKIEELFLEAGFPHGTFQSLLIRSSQVENIIKNPIVKAVTLTGSEYAGSQVASTAASVIKKSVLELGGSDPFIVLDDADLEFTLDNAVTARLQNAGQSCIAAKRFIIHEKIANDFMNGFKARFEKMKVGNPSLDETEMGPVVNMDAIKDLEELINDSVKMGAKIITGGKRIGNKGYLFEPTIVTDITKSMPLYSKETFGPVASVFIVKNIQESIEIANDTEFGLGSSIWTKNIELAKSVAKDIDAGNVFVNQIVRSDPRLPFGGAKKSGYGRELSTYGIKEFVNIKTVVVA
jgi:succinate-semialdehyde dehydrogenase/glutarate-semialdehyde dehydrogenase